jgi:hypothetical protein
MTDQAVPSTAGVSEAAPKADARDLLARLYREIGISAVAAALSINIGHEHNGEATSDNAAAMVRTNKNIAA